MQILAVNCGSSSIKLQLIQVSRGQDEASSARALARANISGIGDTAAAEFHSDDGSSDQTSLDAHDHAHALRVAVEWLSSEGLLDHQELDALGHRVVHGGADLFEPSLIDEGVLKRIDEVVRLAPLHNQASLQAIRASRRLFGDATPMVAVFDTAFHRHMPEHARSYAVPPDTADDCDVRRYGFHGLAHACMCHRAASMLGHPLNELRLVTLQLGSGCSAAAVDRGRSIDTTMGFTPLEGLMMATRSGDIDPAAVGALQRQTGMNTREMERWLNERCGLLGITGTPDAREVIDRAAEGDERAQLGLEMYCYRLRKCIGGFISALGGADAVVFGGGVGENAPAIRAKACEKMQWCGIKIDEQRNDSLGGEGCITVQEASLPVYVARVDEAALIARETATCIAAAENKGAS